MRINIPDKATFVNKFLNPLNKINENAVLKVTSDKISSLTSANDEPGRDPTTFTLWGSNDRVSFTVIKANVVIPMFQSRLTRQVINIDNDDNDKDNASRKQLR